MKITIEKDFFWIFCSTLVEKFIRVASQEILQWTKNRKTESLALIINYIHGKKSSTGLFFTCCIVLLTTFLFDWLGVTKKEPQETDAYFDEKNVITFHGTLIADFVLHILSCVSIPKNTNESNLLTWNVDIIQYEDIRNFRKNFNIWSGSQN